MTRGADVGTVTRLHPDEYRHTLPVTLVKFTGNVLGPFYEPAPSTEWTALESLSWLAGVVSLELNIPLVIGRTHASSTATVGQYSLRIGDRQPMTGLTVTRVMDILGGCMTAVELIK